MDNVAHSIQLALAPVFMLTAIAGLIGALAGRLSRIIDRARRLEEKLEDPLHPETAQFQDELSWLRKRGRFVNTSMILLTLSATLIGATVMALFLVDTFTTRTGNVVPWTFLSGVACFLCALLCFLFETLLAMRALNFGKPDKFTRPGKG